MFEGLRVAITGDRKLEITSEGKGDQASFELKVELFDRDRLIQEQTIGVRPAPATRPVTYYADFGDDLINIFGAGWGGSAPQLHHQIREGGPPAGRRALRTTEGLIQYDKEGFDQYFRRLQCQGVARKFSGSFPFRS